MLQCVPLCIIIHRTNMIRTNIWLGFIVLAVVTIALCWSVLYQMGRFNETVITFLDVGQGDAILISEGTQQILIDGGPDGRRLLEHVGRHMPFWDRTIDVVIATHPDSDHIDGLVALLDAYDVHTFWHSGAQKDTSVSAALSRRIVSTGAQVAIPAIGDTVTLHSGAQLKILYPILTHTPETAQDDANAMSVTAVFTTKSDVFYLGGDLPTSVEDALPLSSDITVAKAGHHGSQTSTSAQFLQRVKPRDVVISSGKDNRYGHPHDDVVKRILRSGARIFRTDRDGTISYVCRETCVIEMK